MTSATFPDIIKNFRTRPDELHRWSSLEIMTPVRAALFAEFVRTRARPEYDLLRFGLSAGDRLPGQSAADAVGLFAPRADREHAAPKSPSVIWILAAVLAGYGEVERLLEAPPDQPLTNIREV